MWEDCSAIAKVSKIEYLYLINQQQATIDRVFSLDSGIGGKDFDTLRFVAITASTDSRSWCIRANEAFILSNSTNLGISNIKCLTNLSEKTARRNLFFRFINKSIRKFNWNRKM